MLAMGVGLSFWLNPRLALVFLIATPVLGTILLRSSCARWPHVRPPSKAV